MPQATIEHHHPLLKALALAICVCTVANETGADPRQVLDATSPPWLSAVGKLSVPSIKTQQGRRRHHREDCSATLVASRGSKEANTLVTAWHCLEFYGDLSRDIEFSLAPPGKAVFHGRAYRLDDGGSMEADWAILRLRPAVPRDWVTALEVHPGRADQAQRIVMAGYSSDPDIGASGARLSYDPACRIVSQGAAHSDSDCVAHKGASGGAVIQRQAEGAVRFSGVISQGDSASISTFVPVSVFRRSLQRHL